jgi:hypothetical protein
MTSNTHGPFSPVVGLNRIWQSPISRSEQYLITESEPGMVYSMRPADVIERNSYSAGLATALQSEWQ